MLLDQLNGAKLEKMCAWQLQNRRAEIQTLQVKCQRLLDEADVGQTLEKNIYVPVNGKLHDFSVHLMPPLNVLGGKSNAYLSLSKSNQLLDNQREVSYYNRLYFFDTKYDRESRVFFGVICWPQPYKGADRMEYTLKFSEDLRYTISGQIISKNQKGQVLSRKKLG